MTLMVLAIRLYDVGLRDDAVFWFYVAKNRYLTLEDVVDVSMPGLASVNAAMKNFAGQVGPYINGYAFCDPGKQHDTMLKAIAWVEKNPYDQIFFGSACRQVRRPQGEPGPVDPAAARQRRRRPRQVQRSEVPRRIHQGAQEEQDRRDVLLEVNGRGSGVRPSFETRALRVLLRMRPVCVGAPRIPTSW
jgi:hypothetical protein